jgi:hypothetical protein
LGNTGIGRRTVLKIDPGEMWREDIEWIQLAWYVNTVIFNKSKEFLEQMNNSQLFEEGSILWS